MNGNERLINATKQLKSDMSTDNLRRVLDIVEAYKGSISPTILGFYLETVNNKFVKNLYNNDNELSMRVMRSKLY